MSGHRRRYNEEEEEYFDYDGYGGEEYNDYDDDAYDDNYEHEEGSISSGHDDGDQLVDDPSHYPLNSLQPPNKQTIGIVELIFYSFNYFRTILLHIHHA